MWNLRMCHGARAEMILREGHNAFQAGHARGPGWPRDVSVPVMNSVLNVLGLARVIPNYNSALWHIRVFTKTACFSYASCPNASIDCTSKAGVAWEFSWT